MPLSIPGQYTVDFALAQHLGDPKVTNVKATKVLILQVLWDDYSGSVHNHTIHNA